MGSGVDLGSATVASVLVADDEANIRKLIRGLLEREGHSVIEAKDGAEALELAQSRPLDLLILDVRMPKLDGFGVLRRLQSADQTDERRVLFLTGATDEEDFLKGWGAGADGYLTKPVDDEVLVDSVAEVLALTPAERKERRQREIERARLLRQLDRFLE